MHFASPIPLWLAFLVAAGIGALAFLSYRRPLAPLTARQRGVLMALRATSMAAVVFFLCRPIVLGPPAADRAMVVPVLVDASRSMRIADADGQTRIVRAAQVLKTLWPELSQRFTPELFGVGNALTPATLDHFSADAPQTDLNGAIAAVRERYRGRRISGIVLISDGGDTGQASAERDGTAPPVFSVGVGSPEGIRDREVLGVNASDPRLDQASVDLHVTAVSHFFGRAPFELRVLANGRVVDTRRIVPTTDGSPVDEVFTLSPDPLNATVFSAEIPADPGEAISENNSRSVLVSPPGRKRRVLAIEGAPGFEHSFMARALSHDSGLDLDSVVRKGKNETGQDTFFVQAATGRAAMLTSGFPAHREDLYGYDAVIVANIEGDFFTRAQLAMLADFVAERGGGLLVMGGRSFAERGLIGTPLEEALPVELNDRRGLLRTAANVTAPHNTVVVTPEGENHPIMRLGATPEETRKLWAGLPALAASAPLGGPKPGALVLAITAVAGGAVYPVVAVQRYGRGRSMVFAGEAAWRWRMMQSSSDRRFEYFWRQAARWLAGPAPDPVAITVPESSEPGDTLGIGVDARDAAFAPAADASVTATLTLPGGESRPLTLRHEAGSGGRFTAAVRPDQTGLYRVHAEASRPDRARQVRPLVLRGRRRS